MSFFLSHTTQSQQWGELSAVMHPSRIRRTRHPQVLVDGRGGDDAPIHRGRPPVTVGQTNPNHHPADEAQQHSHCFHNRIHDDPSSAVPSRKTLSKSQSLENKISKSSCYKNQTIWFRVSSWSVRVCEMRWDVSGSTHMYYGLYDSSLSLLPFHFTLFFPSHFYTPETEQVFIGRFSESNGHPPHLITLWHFVFIGCPRFHILNSHKQSITAESQQINWLYRSINNLTRAANAETYLKLF